MDTPEVEGVLGVGGAREDVECEGEMSEELVCDWNEVLVSRGESAVGVREAPMVV